MSAYEQPVVSLAADDEETPQVVMIPSLLNFDLVDGGDTWDAEGKLTLDGGVVNFVGAAAADDATVDVEKAMNGYFSSTDKGGVLNIVSGAFVLKNASTSTAARYDLVDNVAVTINAGARMIITGREMVNLSADDTIHEGASFKLTDYAKLVLNAVTYLDENDVVSQDLYLVNSDFVLGESTTATFVNNGININISSDQSNYKGIYEQNNEAVTNVLLGGKVFGGAKYINSGELNISADTIDYTEVYLADNATLTNTSYDATTSSVITTNGAGADEKGVLNFIGTGSTAIFKNGVTTAKYAKYDLTSNIQNDKATLVHM